MTPTLHFESGPVALWHVDCIETMRLLPEASFDAVVTDPPYGIAFMGKAWDQPGEFGSTRPGSAPRRSSPAPGRSAASSASGADVAGTYDLSPSAMRNFQRWCEAWAAECFRLLKPGGHLLAFGGSRTWHRLAAGIEDAGFEIRDSIAWLYGSGFPKSLDVSKAIDKHLGAERPVVGVAKGAGNGSVVGLGSKPSMATEYPATAPATAPAITWDGWGTALKPSFEPIVVARKPLAGTVAANVLAHGTGALNIDATRIATTDKWEGRELPNAQDGATWGGVLNSSSSSSHDLGRWPSNLVLDDAAAGELDRQSGVLSSGTMRAGASREPRPGGTIFGADGRTFNPADTYGDSGGASRFFPTFRYEAKAPTSERPVVDGVAHPTVKPLALMRWLCRLVTRPGGRILDLFGGSGSTAEAALAEGFEIVVIEREAEYLPLIVSRVTKPIEQALFGEDGAA